MYNVWQWSSRTSVKINKKYKEIKICFFFLFKVISADLNTFVESFKKVFGNSQKRPPKEKRSVLSSRFF
jgi:hypothetical protein